MKYLILSLVMILFEACEQKTNSESKWQIWETETLKHYQLSFDEIIVLNPKEALLFGEEDTRENRQLMREQQNLSHTGFAVVYKTKDGGKTWQKKTFEKGGFWHTCQSGNTIYATKVVNNGRLAEQTSILYRSTDKGETWEVINEFVGGVAFLALDEQATGYIGGVKADSSKHSRAYSYDVFEIENGQLKEQEDKISYPATWNPESKEILFLKQTDPKAKKSTLFCAFETKAKVLAEYKLPEGVNGYFAEKHGNEYWIIGRKDEQCCIYKMSKAGNFEFVHCFSSNGERIFPESLKVYGDQIVAIIGTRKSGWTENTTYFSSDGGKTWHEEKLPKPQYFNPVDFIQTKEGIFGMAYSGSGMVQVRNPK